MDTRTNLVATARRLFAQRGFRGASVRAITSAAGANLGAITYHFGTKRALYEATLEQCLEPIRDAISEVVTQAGRPMVRIEGVLRAFFAHLRKNPDMPQFILQEIAAGETPSEPVQRTMGHVLGLLASLVEEGQRSGEFRAGDPRLTAVSIVAQPVHLTLLGQLSRWERTEEPVLPVDPDLIEDHAVSFVRTALQSPTKAGTK